MRYWPFAHLNEVAARKGWTKFVCMQDQHSLIYREEDREIHAYCKFNGIDIIPWAARIWHCVPSIGKHYHPCDAFKGTTPFERRVSEDDKVIIKRVEELASKHGKKIAQVALAWSNAKVTSPIAGINPMAGFEHDYIE